MADNMAQKSFWARPEGKTGMITLAAGAGGLYFLAPTMITMFGNLITLLGQTYAIVALAGGLFAIAMVALDGSFQRLVKNVFKLGMRSLTGWVIEIDPIGIMKNYIQDAMKKLDQMGEAKDALRGQMSICERQIKTNADEIDKQMKTAQVAQRQGITSAFNVASAQAGRLTALNRDKLGPLLLQMQAHMRLLDKYYEVTQTVIEDTKNEVKAGEMERNMVLSSYKAMSLAKRIIMGAGEDKEMFDQAKEYVAQDIGMKLGRIDSFINDSKGFVESLDIQNGVFQADALAKLQEWETRADSILISRGKQDLISNQPAQPLLVGTMVSPTPVSVDYSSMLKK